MNDLDRHYENEIDRADRMENLVDEYLHCMDNWEIAEVICEISDLLGDLYVINIDQAADCFEVEKFIKANSIQLARLWTLLKNKEVGIFGLFKMQMENSLLNHAESTIDNEYN